jgi:uncharacterized protein
VTGRAAAAGPPTRVFNSAKAKATAPATATATALSARDARRMTLRAQGLLVPRISGGPLGVLQHLRAVQLDTIAVLARSHELVPYARLGAVPRRRVERAFWGVEPPRNAPLAFEHWSRAACVLPIEDWPHTQFQREDRRAKGRGWHRLEDGGRHRAAVLQQLASEGPQTARQLGGAKRGGPWWDWSDVKIAVEQLLEVGDAVCTQRIGFQRVYDLPERAIPRVLLSTNVPRDEQVRHLLAGALEALGVATVADLAAYCGIRVQEAGPALAGLGLPQVAVEGWTGTAFCDPGALARSTKGLRSRPVLLSPFDSTIWYRPRVARVFGFHHRLEAYVPRPKRVHGYFSMPVLVGDALVARVDPAREGATLVARSLHLEGDVRPGAVAPGIGAALAEAARWVGATSVVLERVEPKGARAPVEAALGFDGLR